MNCFCNSSCRNEKQENTINLLFVADSAEERAKNIFAKMDENNDGQLTQDEFLKGCLQDEELSKMLAP